MITTRLSFLFITASSVLVAVASWRFLGLGLDASFPGFEDHLQARRFAFAVHVIASPVALTLGVLQFMPRLRARKPALHRWTGRVYALSILAGGLAGLWLALNAPGGLVAGVGFAALAIMWLATTAKAVFDAMNKDIVTHREWMIRSFALTFSGVTLRIYLAAYSIAGIDYVVASPVLAWICWVPNLIVAEWWIARTRRKTAANRIRVNES